MPRPAAPRSGLAQLHRLQQLEALDLGWCRAVGDADAAALGALTALRELNLARTQVAPRGGRPGHAAAAVVCANAAVWRWRGRGTPAGARRPARRPGAVQPCPASPTHLAAQYFPLQVSDEGLAHLHSLSELQVLNLAGLQVRCVCAHRRLTPSLACVHSWRVLKP